MNRIEIDPRDIDRVKLRVTGDNNIVIVKKLSDETVGKVSISLAGNDCSIILDAGINIGEALNIFAGQIHPNFGKINNTHIYIGKGTSFEKTTIATANANSSIEIGERCMFSYGITVYNTDSHPIIDAASGNIINKVKQLKIGDHVWVGANATILKNTHIPDDCIVGWGAVVNSKSLYPPPPPRKFAKRLCNRRQSGENRKNGDYLGQRRIERLCAKRGRNGANFRTRRIDCRFAARERLYTA